MCKSEQPPLEVSVNIGPRPPRCDSGEHACLSVAVDVCAGYFRRAGVARCGDAQPTVFGLRNRAMEVVFALIGDIKDARGRGTADAEIDLPLKLHRRSQFMLDFVEAENSTGFHAPEEAERILAESIDYARQGQLALRGAKVPGLQTSRTVKPAAHVGPKAQ